MIEKLTHVPIVVSDQEKALKFYTEVLGFEKRADYQKDRKSTRLNSSHVSTSYAVFCLKKKKRLRHCGFGCCLSVTSAQWRFRVCREGKPVPTRANAVLRTPKPSCHEFRKSRAFGAKGK